VKLQAEKDELERLVKEEEFTIADQQQKLKDA
jgi:hypothetical protein